MHRLVRSPRFFCLALLLVPLSPHAGSISGTIRYDEELHGPIVVQAVRTAPGNQVLHLDGDGDYVRIPDLTDLSGSEIAIRYWFRGSSAQSAVRIQASDWIVTGWNYRHIISNDSGTDGIGMGNAVTDGGWHQVTMTWKQGEPDGFAGYLDGQLVDSRDAADVPIPVHGSPLHFGAFQGSAEFAKGQLDEISVWNRALSSEEVGRNWFRRLSGNEDGLVGYWTFDEGTAEDRGPEGYDGDLFGDAYIDEAGVPGLGAWHSLVLDGPGTYRIEGVDDGDGYDLLAFVDENGNGLQDEGEPWGEYEGNGFSVSGDRQGADLQIRNQPAIIASPEDIRIASGQSLQLEVGADGTPPLSYRWERNGEPLSDGGNVAGAQSATLVISQASSQDSGAYLCRVSNAIGEAASTPALVRVIEGGVNLSGTVSYDGEQEGPILVTGANIRSDNQVLRLDGDGDYAVTPLTDLSGPEITIQYWFRGENVQSAVRQQSSGYIVAGWNGLHILSIDLGTNGISAGGDAVTDGNWHHLVMTWKQDTPGGFRSYLDGVLVAERDSTDGEIPDLEAQVHFGCFNGSAEWMNGELDEIAIWDRALTEGEIATGWNQPLTGDEEGLVGYWTFDDGLGEDAVGGNHAELRGDATLVGATVPGLGSEVYGTTLEAPGSYTLETILPGSNYEVLAFMDVNGNGGPDEEEPSGSHIGNPFDLTGDATGIDIVLVEKPRIAIEPDDVRAVGAGTATFRAEASGSPPLEWQWMRNGEAIGDDGTFGGTSTPTLRISGIGPEDAGRYSVRVSNEKGSATSRDARLSVIEGETATLSGTLLYTGSPAGRIHMSTSRFRSDNLALRLDGDGDHVVVEDLTDLSGFEITIQFWYRGSNFQSPVRQQSGGWIVAGWSTGDLHILSNDGGTSGIRAGDGITDGRWHHVAMTWEFDTPDGFRSYLDGRPVSSRDSSAQEIPDHGHPLFFGAFQGTAEFTNGEIDEIAIWEIALEEADIRSNWNQPLTGEEDGLIGLWKFDEGDARDSGPYFFDGALMGDAAIVPAEIPGFSGVVHTDILDSAGDFALPNLPLGDNYGLSAFVDVNGNYRHDDDEPSATWEGNPFTIDGDLEGIVLDLGGEVVQSVVLEIRTDGDALLVTWPGGGTLHQTDDLASGTWTPVAGSGNGSARIVPTGGMRFYQLR